MKAARPAAATSAIAFGVVLSRGRSTSDISSSTTVISSNASDILTLTGEAGGSDAVLICNDEGGGVTATIGSAPAADDGLAPAADEGGGVAAITGSADGRVPAADEGGGVAAITGSTDGLVPADADEGGVACLGVLLMIRASKSCRKGHRGSGAETNERNKEPQVPLSVDFS